MIVLAMKSKHPYVTKIGPHIHALKKDTETGYMYNILDAIDTTLTSRGAFRLSSMVELANLSSMLGNLLRLGIVESSVGVFLASGPHKYQDLRHYQDEVSNIEIKVA